MRRLAIATALLLVGAAPLADERRRLHAAEHDAAAARARAAALTARAGNERDAAAAVRTEQAAMQARIVAAEADIAAAAARRAIVVQLLDRQRARLGAAQMPVAELLAALQAMARRPAIVAMAQPGSVDDLVHVRAALGGTLPLVHARTDAIRQELAQTRALIAEMAQAERALGEGRVQLERQRGALAALEARHRAVAASLDRSAIDESDRALALGERARDLVDRMTEAGMAAATGADLAALDGPQPRPLAPDAVLPAPIAGRYRLPVAGRVETGFGELSDAGVRARGLTLAPAPGAAVAAPAAGVVRYAARFRDYGVIIIIDHGDGWTSLVAGLGDATVRPGAAVRQGALVGHAGSGDDPRVTVELRRRGRPVDIAALIG